MKKFSVLAAPVVSAVVLSLPAFASDADIKAALAGKTIVAEENNAEFKLRKNGRITGKAGTKQDIKFSGAWTIREGQFCRTFQEPERFAGTECQPIELGSGTVTITGRNGPILYKFK